MKTRFMLIITALLSVCTMNGQDRVYKIGDLYDADGIKGVVFSIEDGGRHGKIVALENSGEREVWGNPAYFISSGPNADRHTPTCRHAGGMWEYDTDGITLEMVAKAFSGATDYNDGAYNCDKIVDNFISEEGNIASLNCHPLADMVSSFIEWPDILPKMDGGVICAHFNKFAMAEKLPSYKYNWYIPAIKELEELYGACAQDDLNEKLINAGGKPLKGIFWSSTEISHYSKEFDINFSSDAFAYNMNEGYDFGCYKNEYGLKVRLIRRF